MPTMKSLMRQLVIGTCLVTLPFSILTAQIFGPPEKAGATTGGTLRQEINILDGVLAVSSTSSEIVQLDTRKYSGTVSYYFEVVTSAASANTDSTTLTRNGTVTNDSTISLAATGANVRVRSTAFTPPASTTTEYVVKTGANHPLKAARIIIIQNSSTLSSTETQIEIGNRETVKVNTASAALTTPKYWKYTAANWDGGTVSFSAEVVKAQSATNFTTTVTLQQDNGSFGGWTDLVTIVSNTTTATTRTRVSFTPTDGRNYRLASLESSANGGRNYSLYNGKIIVNQLNNSTATSDSYDTSANSLSISTGGITIGAYQSFTATAGTLDSAAFRTTRVGTPPGNINAYLFTHSGTYGSSSVPAGSALASSDAVVASTATNGGYTTFTFSGLNRITLTAGTKYIIYVEYPFGDASNLIQVSYNAAGTHSGNMGRYTGTYNADNAADLAFKVNENAITDISKLEPQHMLLNTADSNVTGLQGFNTLWDSTEWSGFTNTFKFAIDSDNASNSAKLQDTSNANADVTGATATGANQQISAGFTMPATGHNLDVNVTNTTGTIGAVRIIVAAVITPIISVSVTDGSVAYGIVGASASADTTSGGLNDTQTATNDGNVSEDFNIKGQNSANWTLAGSVGSNQYKQEVCISGSGSPDPCDSSPTYTALTTSYALMTSNLASTGTQKFDLRLTMPSSSTSSAQQSVDVTVQAVIH